MPPLSIYLFGVPRFERQGTPIHIPRRKAIALLAYLATTAQPHSRDALGTMFWPENDQSSARANLRRELSRIKSALGDQPFETHQEQVGLKRGSWWLDIDVFQTRLKDLQAKLSNGSASAQEADLSKYIVEIKEVVKLYTGEFMAGFSLPDSPQFDEWQFFQRENLRRSLGEALQQLVFWETAQGEYSQAIDYARRWLALDNLFEPAHRQLMQLYAWSGQHGAALRQFEQIVRLLDQEIGVEPEEETLSLYKAIKARQLPPPDIESIRLVIPWITAAGLPGQQAVSQEAGEDIKQRAFSLIDPTIQSTPFIGREKEYAQICRLLIEDTYSRLVNVVGPGGVGKTRLALEAASAVQEAFPDGVYLIPLASLASADQILSLIAERLHFRFHESAGQEGQLFDYLRQKQMLLVMDNFEHVLPGVSLLKQLLHTAPEVKVMVTSRERLNLVDEMVITLSGMDYPEMIEGTLSKADLSAYEAIQLLVQSARRVQPEFELGAQDLESAAHLCGLVEGVPLAIILAAGWLEMLSLKEIVEEISQSLDFLESQAQDIPERQRSLRAVFDASWSMLDEQQKLTLERLAIFKGSFTRQAALAVTGTSHPTLLALIQKAWLQRNQERRFQIHEIQRQYVTEKLHANPPAWAQARHEHSTYYALRLEKLSEIMRGADQDAAYDEVALEFENISLAWNWLVEQKRFDTLVQQMLLPLYRYCEARVKSKELLQLVDIILGALESRMEGAGFRNELAIFLTVQASFYSKGDSVRLDRYDIIIPLAYEDNIHRVAALVDTSENLVRMGSWGILFSYLYGRFVDSHHGQQYLRELAQNYRQADQLWELAMALQMLGSLNLVVALNATQKEPVLVEAGQCLTEALGIFDQLGDTYSSISWLLGDLLFKTGDYETAFQYYQEIREKYLQRGHKRIAAYALSFESLQALRYSDIEHARQTREMSIRLSQEVGDPFGEAWSTWEMGEIYRVAGESDTATLWFERARAMFERVKEPNGEIFYHRGLGDIALAMGDEAQAYRQFELCLQHARRVSFNWGTTYALAGLGRAAVALGNFEVARIHLFEGLQSAIASRDGGLALVVLAGWANLFAHRGEREKAIKISRLVSGHFAAWRETKTQAKAILNGLEDMPPQPQTPTQERGSHDEIWDLANRLLQTNLKPA